MKEKMPDIPAAPPQRGWQNASADEVPMFVGIEEEEGPVFDWTEAEKTQIVELYERFTQNVLSSAKAQELSGKRSRLMKLVGVNPIPEWISTLITRAANEKGLPSVAEIVQRRPWEDTTNVVIDEGSVNRRRYRVSFQDAMTVISRAEELARTELE
jgi:hypothetical protein